MSTKYVTVSLSMPEEMLKEINEVVGDRSRSKVIREWIKDKLDDMRYTFKKDKLRDIIVADDGTQKYTTDEILSTLRKIRDEE